LGGGEFQGICGVSIYCGSTLGLWLFLFSLPNDDFDDMQKSRNLVDFLLR